MKFALKSVAFFLLLGTFFNDSFSQTALPIAVSVEVYAGTMSSSGNIVGDRLTARLNEPIDMVYDASGNLYIAEEGGSSIKKMDVNGVISEFVGSPGVAGFVDGTGAVARFNQIRGIALDNNGNLIVADKDNHSIRKVTPAGVVTTISGSSAGFADGDVSVALFNKPTNVLVASNGDIYITDANNFRVRKINSEGDVSTVVGKSTSGYQDGTVTEATLSGVTGVEFDSEGNLIIATFNALRKLDLSTGVVSTIVGGSTATTYLDGDKDNAGFDAINGLYIDSKDVIYIADRHGFRHVSGNGTVTTLAGNAVQGVANGNPLDSRFHYPRGVIKTPENNFLIADKANHVIRRINMNYPPVFTSVSAVSYAENGAGIVYTVSATDPSTVSYSLGNSRDEALFNINGVSGEITFKSSPDFESPGDSDTNNTYLIEVIANDGTHTVSQEVTITVTDIDEVTAIQTALPIAVSVEVYAGTMSSSGNIVGDRLTARLNEPIDMVYDASGNLYIAEEGGSSIKKMDVNGVISEFVGSPGVAGFVDGTGAVARFNQIRGIALDNNGNLIVADKDNHSIRKVTPAGVVTTISGSSAGFADGDVSVALFNKPTNVLVASNGDIYITDANNFRVRKINSEGDVSTVVGKSTSGYQDGTVTEATLSGVTGVEFDSEGNLIIATFNALRKLDLSTGVVSTIVGGSTATTYLDGDKDNAGFDAINGLYIDSKDVIYIADRHGFRHVSGNGTVTTLAGNAVQGVANGNPLDSRFHYPRGVIKTPENNFLIADKANHVIRRINMNYPPVFTSVSAVSYAENGAGIVYTVSATDPSTVSYSLGNSRDEALFNINGVSGEITFKSSPDFESPGDSDTNNTYLIEVIANDGTHTVSQEVIITVTDIDEIKPTVIVSSTSSVLTSGVFDITITFNESVTGFISSDVVLANGVLSNFAGSGTSYTATVTPLVDGSVTVDVPSNVAQDAATNNNIAAAQFSIENDETKPIVTITSTSSTLTSGAFDVTITFSEAVTDFVSSDVVLTNGVLSNFAGSGTSYTATVTPSADGSVTVDVPSNVAQDAATNNNIAAAQFSIENDETKPIVTITSTSSTLTSGAFDVTITFSEAVTDFVSSDVVLTNGVLSNFAGSGTSYTATVTPSADGSVTVDVPSNVAQDAATNNNIAAAQFSIVNDQTKPTVIVSSTSSVLTSGAFDITITFSESVTGFISSDVVLANGVLSNFAGSGTSYTATVTPLVDGSVTVDVPSDVAQDAATNNNTAAAQFSIVNDQTKPSVVLSKTTDKPVSGAFTVLIKFSENISGFDLTDLSLSAGTKSDLVQVDQSTYTVLVKSDVSSIDLSMAAGVTQDLAGNMNTEPTSLNLEFNSLPSDIGISNQSLNENSGVGLLVGLFNTVDNEGDVHIYTLISGTGDADNNSFTINGTKLLTAEDFDFETKSTYSIRVKSTDSFGEVYEKSLEITVLNLPEAQINVTDNPVIPSTALGLKSSFDIVISNDGDGDLIVTEVVYFDGFTGATTGFTVSPSSSKTITIDFSPIEEKTYSGNIVIKSNLGETSLAVSATGEVVTGIDDEVGNAFEVLIYPNPVRDILTLDLSSIQNKRVEVQLLNIVGEVIYSTKELTEGMLKIDVSFYQQGYYLVSMVVEGGRVVRKVLITR